MIDKRIWQDMMPHKKCLCYLLLFNTVQAIMVVLSSYIVAYLANELLFAELGYAAATPVLVLLFFFLTIKAILGYINHAKMKEISLKLQSKLRCKLLQSLAYNTALGEKRVCGQWLSLITKGVDKLDVYITNFLPQLATLAVLPLILLICALVNDWISGLIFLITAPLIPLFMIFIGKLADAENKKQWLLFQRLTVFMANLLPALLVVKAYNQAQVQLQRLYRNDEVFARATLKVLRLAFVSAFMLEFISTLSIAIIAVNIGLRLLYGQAEFLPVFFILLIAPQFYQPFRQFGSAFHDAMNGIVASAEIYALIDKLDKREEVTSLYDKVDLAKAPKIRFVDVNYAYEMNVSVLQNLNFTVDSGEQVALVGRNGAGKSTVFKLMLKLLEMQSGTIYIDDKVLSEIDKHNWQQQIGWASQEPYIFSASLKENIALGRSCTDEDIVKVIRQVNLEKFVQSLPQGINTIIGGAVKLSSGQRRRLGIARALLLSPKLLLLDEPMENLDAHNEKLIRDLLDKLKGNVTVIIIAHRLQTIKHVDQVIFLQDGNIVESGRAEVLLQQDGYFHNLIDTAERAR